MPLSSTVADQSAESGNVCGIRPLQPRRSLGPLASEWVEQLFAWYKKLQVHFGFDSSNLAANVARNAHKWRRRLLFLKESQVQLFDFIMDFISNGHSIPFEKVPAKYFRKSNPPSLRKDKMRTWTAVKKDMSHGAIAPVDVKRDGVPWCVCPVRTADKNDGTARFVHNTRHVNAGIAKEHTQCELETLLRTRNMYIKDGFLIGSDYASDYHCIFIGKESRKYLAFALHVSELSEEALKWLHTHHPEAYYHKKRCFLFIYLALPFGLATSCKVFNSLIASLVASWRRYESGGEPTRASSYIDDVVGVQKAFAAAMMLSIRMVFEAVSLSLSLKVPKCSFFPRKAMVALGTIVDLASYTFKVSSCRARKLEQAVSDLEREVVRRPTAVPAKLVATFVGLIWSIANCCQRAASVMTRDIISLLSVSMRQLISTSSRSLSLSEY